jgi:rod shape-determining protein MreB
MLGIAPTSTFRLHAALKYVLSIVAHGEGHVYLPLPELVDRTARQLDERRATTGGWEPESELAAAIGARLPVATTDGLLVANLGAGSTEVAAIANGEVLAMESIVAGGRALDEAIAARVQAEHHLRLEPGEAERLKLQLGSALATQPEESLEVSAVDASGRPATIAVASSCVEAAIVDSVDVMVDCVQRVLGELPAARRTSVQRNGLILTGGGARLRGLAEFFASKTGLPVRVAAQPEACIALGTGMALDNLAVVRRGQHYIT